MIIRHKLVKDKNCVLGVGVEVCPKGPFLLVGETMEYIDRRLAKIEAQAQEIERLRKAICFHMVDQVPAHVAEHVRPMSDDETVNYFVKHNQE